MPGPLPVVAAAAFVLAAAPAPATPLDPAPVVAPGGGAFVAYAQAPEILAREVGPDGTPTGDPVALTAEGAGRRLAMAPTLLSRGDGTFLMAYSARSGLGAAGRRTVKLRRVAARGPLGPIRAAGPGAPEREGDEAAPALAWGPGRRWAVIAWAQASGATHDGLDATAQVLARRMTPDGRWLGGRVVLDRVPLGRRPDGFVSRWSRAAPTLATDGAGVLAVWSGTAGAKLRAARIGAGGRVARVALGLRAALQRRALGRRAPARVLRETAPRLLARPGARPALAWGATIPEGEETLYRSALLVATVPGPRAIRAAHGPEDLVSSDAETPTALVAEPGGTLALAWTTDEVVVAGRGCSGDQLPFARRLSAALRPLGPARGLSTGADPRGPDEFSSASGTDCRPPIGHAALAPIASGLLATYSWSPNLDARVLAAGG